MTGLTPGQRTDIAHRHAIAALRTDGEAAGVLPVLVSVFTEDREAVVPMLRWLCYYAARLAQSLAEVEGVDRTVILDRLEVEALLSSEFGADA